MTEPTSFDRIAGTAGTARELYDEMLKLHPLRMNVNALWTSARAMKPFSSIAPSRSDAREGETKLPSGAQ